MASELLNFLVDPPEPDDSVTDGYANPGDIFNYASPSAWIADVIERVSGWNPFDYATEWFTGEWARFWKYGAALDSLGDFMEAFGVKLQNHTLRVDGSWTGNAADVSYNFFTDFASAVSQQQIALKAAGEAYKEASRGVWQLSKQLGNVLQAIVDEAILQALVVGAGIVTAATGAGLVVTGAVATVQTARILKLLATASKIINTSIMVIMSLFGGALAIVSQGGSLSNIKLPDADSFQLHMKLEAAGL